MQKPTEYYTVNEDTGDVTLRDLDAMEVYDMTMDSTGVDDSLTLLGTGTDVDESEATGTIVYKYDTYKIKLTAREGLTEHVAANFDAYLEKGAEQAEEAIKANWRGQRDDAFVRIDRYQMTLVYNSLSDEEKEELATYRQEWLDVTDTQVLPAKPSWM